MAENPFGEIDRPKRRSPFGDDQDDNSPEAALERMEHAARKIRTLRTQIGAEGLTLPATRELIDQVAGAIEAAAVAVRGLRRP